MRRSAYDHIFIGEDNPHLYVDGMVSEDIVGTAVNKDTYCTSICGLRFLPKKWKAEKWLCRSCIQVVETYAEPAD